MFLIDVVTKMNEQGNLYVSLDNDIAAGTPVWQESLGWDAIIPERDILDVDKDMQRLMMKRGVKRHWAGNDCWYLPVDEARYMQQSLTPNLIESKEIPGQWVANQTIKTGTPLSW